jgi:hypothetical protein
MLIVAASITDSSAKEVVAVLNKIVVNKSTPSSFLISLPPLFSKGLILLTPN